MASGLRRIPNESRKRRSGAASRHVERILWIFATLLYERVLDFGACRDRCGISLREFQRDLRILRETGADLGVSISHMKGGRVFLYGLRDGVKRLGAEGRDFKATLARIAAALGGPIQHEIHEVLGAVSTGCNLNEERPGFLHLRDARPADGERVTHVFEFLKDAAAGPARVEFWYTPARSGRNLRRVEPYHVVERTGRYYLVAYDLNRRDWRHFALDAVSGPMRKDGTFIRRIVPERFLADRAVGWISGPRSVDVTIHATPVIVAAILSRIWQQGQKLTRLPDGGAEITLAFTDLAEAVRVTLSYGAEATIVSPPEAVELARVTVEEIARRYGVTLRVAKTVHADRSETATG